jgi:hypothetical protein
MFGDLKDGLAEQCFKQIGYNFSEVFCFRRIKESRDDILDSFGENFIDFLFAVLFVSEVLCGDKEFVDVLGVLGY